PAGAARGPGGGRAAQRRRGSRGGPGTVAATQRIPVMDIEVRTMGTPVKRLAAVLGVLAMLLTGCGESNSVAPAPEVVLNPPSPSGMEEMPPQPAQMPDPKAEDCDRTASLRPFPTRA